MGFFGDIWGAIKGSGSTIGNALTGGAMGIATNALGKLFGGGGPSQEQLMSMQYDYQRKLMELQASINKNQAKVSNQLAKDMWDYTNFKNQVKHLKAAGLNPALLYGKGGAGGATTGGAGQAAGVGLPTAVSPTMALEWQSMQADIDLKRAEAAKVAAETKKTDKETTKTEAETTNIEQTKEEILQRVRGAKADNIVKEFEAWTKQLMKNSTYWEDGKEMSYEQAFIENTFKELKNKGIELDTQERELLNKKGIAERLAKDLDKLAEGEFAKASEAIARSQRAVNERDASFWDKERKKWEYEQDTALSKILDKIGGDGDYAKLLTKILKNILK